MDPIPPPDVGSSTGQITAPPQQMCHLIADDNYAHAKGETCKRGPA